MAVIDIKSAYRAVFIHPENKKYMGLRWDIQGKEVFIEDSRLCFGLSLGPMVFNSISNFVYSILTDVYNLQAVNYLDDFLVLGHTKEEAQFAQNRPIVIKTLRYLGFYISWAKVTPPPMFVGTWGLILIHRNGTEVAQRQTRKNNISHFHFLFHENYRIITPWRSHDDKLEIIWCKICLFRNGKNHAQLPTDPGCSQGGLSYALDWILMEISLNLVKLAIVY